MADIISDLEGPRLTFGELWRKYSRTEAYCLASESRAITVTDGEVRVGVPSDIVENLLPYQHGEFRAVPSVVLLTAIPMELNLLEAEVQNLEEVMQEDENEYWESIPPHERYGDAPDSIDFSNRLSVLGFLRIACQGFIKSHLQSIPTTIRASIPPEPLDDTFEIPVLANHIYDLVDAWIQSVSDLIADSKDASIKSSLEEIQSALREAREFEQS